METVSLNYVSARCQYPFHCRETGCLSEAPGRHQSSACSRRAPESVSIAVQSQALICVNCDVIFDGVRFACFGILPILLESEKKGSPRQLRVKNEGRVVP